MPFEIESVHLGEVKLLRAARFGDPRGWFAEAYRRDAFEALGLPGEWPQDNHSRSAKGVIRGLHFQWDPPMAKCMRVTVGRAFLVAVDIRKGSPSVGGWFGVESEAGDGLQLYAPAGFARGFCVLSENAEIQYKCTAIYNPAGEGGIRWDDPAIGVAWPLDEIGTPNLSGKDRDAPTLAAWHARPESDAFRFSSS